MEQQQDLLTYPTWERYMVLSSCIGKLTISDRRRIFLTARTSCGEWNNVLLPKFGFTLSEFAVWYTIGDQRRRSTA